MSYTTPDFSDDAIQLLTLAGYTVHEEADDDTRDSGGVAGFHFAWARPDGRGDVETGESCETELAAWAGALAHHLTEAEIPFHEAGPPDSVQVNLTFPDGLMRDLMTTAVEGGIGNWCDLTRRPERDMTGTFETNGDHMNVVSFEADVQDGPVACDHPDIEAAEIGRFTMDAATMRAGVRRMLAPGAQVSPAHVNALIRAGADPASCEWDADTADCVVQFAVFGELVFG